MGKEGYGMTSRFVFAACMLLLVALPSCVWSSAEKAQTDEERLLVLAAKESKKIESNERGIADMIHELIEDKTIA